jgi:hypothetical protein
VIDEYESNHVCEHHMRGLDLTCRDAFGQRNVTRKSGINEKLPEDDLELTYNL